MAFLGAYAWPILDPRLSPAAASFCLVVQWVAWAAFAGDYLVRLRLAPRKWLFVRKNLLDLAVIALPLLRPLRLLRLVVLLRIFNRSATLGLRGRVSAYVAGGAVLLALVAALAVLDAERDNPDANITSIGDALWWACTTMSTVGYGDRYPTTTLGRLVAVGLMVSGIALLGTVTATLASWLSDRVRVEVDEKSDDLAAEVAQLRAQIAELTQTLGVPSGVEVAPDLPLDPGGSKLSQAEIGPR